MSKQEELEARIREQRTVEANKKGLVGQNGKIGVVLRVFGSPVIGQSEGGVYVDTNYMDTRPPIGPEEPRNNSEYMRSIPTVSTEEVSRPEGEEWSEMDEPDQASTYSVGWHFDGLSRGMHMEIMYKEETMVLTVHHKGFLVYKELRGELVSYAPNDEWEGWLDRLAKAAKEKIRKQKEEEFQKQVEVAEKTKESWWESMKARWGVK